MNRYQGKLMELFFYQRKIHYVTLLHWNTLFFMDFLGERINICSSTLVIKGEFGLEEKKK